ncbi:ATP-binding protein [Mycobacterium sp.]|uniref:ATP-binding protein n=1 Tax=Mycobacterium sp. TaxID=1785 RepID=UPI003BB223C9
MRQAEPRAVREFLDRAFAGPAGMVVEGEAGMGKTTFLWHVAEAAGIKGFRVLSTCGSPTEARYAYAAVADLLSAVDTAVLANLPAAQRAALERVLLLDGEGPPTNERMVAAAFLSVIQHPGVDAPVLMAIDDAQWLDVSSQAVFGYAARRLSGRVGILATVRTGEPGLGDPPSWLRFARPDSTVRIRMSPLSLGGVHALISKRLGHTLPRPVITRIHEISGGNPFFALELARSVADEPSRGVVDLPDSLAVLVRKRIGQPDDELSAVLLAASCTVFPTVERLSRAIDLNIDRVVEVIESAEASGVVALEGNEIRFCHPLFASGVYTGASPPQRRAMHRKLADTVEEPELKARHLALAATTGDPAMLDALDEAAEVTLAQGAPAVAAELLELAIKLGGDTPVRRIRAAEKHFRSGALWRARSLLQSTIDGLPPTGPLRCVALMLLAAVTGYDEDMVSAVAALTQAVEVAEDPALQLQSRLLLTPAVGLTGRMKESVDHARTAVAEAEQLGNAGLRSQALTMWVLVSFMYGLGFDRQAMQTALDLEESNSEAAATYQASAVAAVMAAWTGDLVSARTQMQSAQRRFLQGGTEIDILWAANHLTMIDLWLGRYDEAAATAADAVQRAEQMGGKHMLISSWASQAAVAAHVGREDEARTAARSAIDTARATGATFLVNSAITAHAFLEVSIGNHAAALAALEPLLASFDSTHDTEIMVGAYVPDAIESLTALGRADEAEPLVAALEHKGAQHDRPWMLAVAARGRGHVLAARGELEAAERIAQEAIGHHQRLPMPFEMARTQLLLGQLQRRRRRKQAAEATLREALESFDRLAAPLWARRVRAELARLTGPASAAVGLTVAEQRVAERAAAGLSNKQIAAELFIAPKTVEMNLSSVYRKLGIRSRAALSAALQAGDVQGKP